MTISELIDKLKTFPKDMRVVTRGYENGWSDPRSIGKIEVHLDVYELGDCSGKHQTHGIDEYCCRRGYSGFSSNDIEEVVFISEFRK